MDTSKLYSAVRESGQHPAYVKAVFYDAQGRRCTEFVAQCGATTRDRNADAAFIAAAFNQREQRQRRAGPE